VRAAHFHSRFQFLTALLLASVTIVLADKAFAAFYVDDFEVDEVGSCAIDSWMSFASNKDFMAVTSPSCVVQVGKSPVELGVEYQRSREDGIWKTQGAVSGKVTLVRMTKGIGVGLSGELNWDLITGASMGAISIFRSASISARTCA
jgi:hypothetical protein